MDSDDLEESVRPGFFAWAQRRSDRRGLSEMLRDCISSLVRSGLSVLLWFSNLNGQT